MEADEKDEKDRNIEQHHKGSVEINTKRTDQGRKTC